MLSSIIPDELLLVKDAHKHFLAKAEKLGINTIIVWDRPTYLERPEEGWRNNEACVEIVGWFRKKRYNIIPLVKGSYEEQIKHLF